MKNPFKRNLKTYRNYVCPYCFNQVNKCTCKEYPPYTLIQIDEGIQKTIRELNKKGYKTRFSCEGHYDYTYNIYIRFWKIYEFNLPEGFIKQDGFTIEHKIKELNNEEKFNQEKEKYLDVLEKWVETLEPVEE